MVQPCALYSTVLAKITECSPSMLVVYGWYKCRYSVGLILWLSDKVTDCWHCVVCWQWHSDNDNSAVWCLWWLWNGFKLKMFTERFILKCRDCIIFNRKPNVGSSCDRGKSSFDQDNCLVANIFSLLLLLAWNIPTPMFMTLVWSIHKKSLCMPRLILSYNFLCSGAVLQGNHKIMVEFQFLVGSL